MFFLRDGTCRRHLVRTLGLLWWIVAFDAADVVVFALFPQLITLFDHARIGQDMAVAAEKLGLGNSNRGEIGAGFDCFLGS